ncbi:MAG: hypothetical protein Q8P41_09950 [Pseudomonadota bacterium]|nr:hypothetical protein [Pseudomonadota bacterium]
MTPRTVLFCMLASGCVPSIGDRLAVEPRDWVFAGMYDAASLVSLDDGAVNSDFAWAPSPGMTASCGATRGPFGMGVPEAEAIASGRTPAVAILLEYWPARPHPLERDQVRILIDRVDPPAGQPSLWRLEPAVLPRQLRVEIPPYANPVERDALQRAVEISLCLEHAVGRAWVGGTPGEVREALLAERPASTEDTERYFVGQGAPVPALLGAPDACIVGGAGAADSPSPRVKLDTAGVWGGRLRACAPDSEGPAVIVPLGASPERDAVDAVHHIGTPAWQDVRLELGEDPAPCPAGSVQRTVGGAAAGVVTRICVDGAGDGAPRPLRPDQPATTDPDGASGYLDVVAALPATYPTLSYDWDEGGDAEEHVTYALLLVPAWQIAPALGADDPVGALLSDPSMLSIQVYQAAEDHPEGWTELNFLRAAPATTGFGYTLDPREARDPVVGVLDGALTSADAANAHGASVQAWFLASCAAIGLAVVLGIRRIPELWRPSPEVRLERWTVAADDPGDAP